MENDPKFYLRPGLNWFGPKMAMLKLKKSGGLIQPPPHSLDGPKSPPWLGLINKWSRKTCWNLDLGIRKWFCGVRKWVRGYENGFYQIVNPKIKSYLYSIRDECYCKYLLQIYILSNHLLKYTTYLLHEFCILNIMYHGNFAHGKVLFNYPWI